MTQYSMEEVLDAYNSGGDTYTMSDGTTMSRYDVVMLVMAMSDAFNKGEAVVDFGEEPNSKLLHPDPGMDDHKSTSRGSAAEKGTRRSAGSSVGGGGDDARDALYGRALGTGDRDATFKTSVRVLGDGGGGGGEDARKALYGAENDDDDPSKPIQTVKVIGDGGGGGGEDARKLVRC